MNFDRKLDFSRYDDVPENLPEYPARVLFGHITMKGMQLGSVVGCMSIPIVSLVRKQPVGLTARTVFPLTVMGGLAVGYSRLYMAYLDGKLDEKGVDDRAYRLIKNVEQRKVDQYTAMGAIIGVVAGLTAAKGRPGVTLSSACMGIVCGIVSHLVEEKFAPISDNSSLK